MGFDPVGGELKDFTVTFNRLEHHAGVFFAIERGFENFFGSASGQLVRLGGGIGNAEGKSPLAGDGIERACGAGRNDEEFAAVVENAKFLKREGHGSGFGGGVRVRGGPPGEFQLDQSDGPADAARGNAIFGEAFDGT